MHLQRTVLLVVTQIRTSDVNSLQRRLATSEQIPKRRNEIGRFTMNSVRATLSTFRHFLLPPRSASGSENSGNVLGDFSISTGPLLS